MKHSWPPLKARRLSTNAKCIMPQVRARLDVAEAKVPVLPMHSQRLLGMSYSDRGFDGTPNYFCQLLGFKMRR